MSNLAPLFNGSTPATRPEHLRGKGTDAITKKLAGGSTGLRISIKGGVFRMLNGTEEIQHIDERSLNVVIVAIAPSVSRTLYAGSYVEGESKPPVCWSHDNVYPAAEVVNKQSPSCATCAKNVRGSSGTGTSRACKYSRQIAVVLEGDLAGKVFKMSLPSESIFGKAEGKIMPLEAYGKHVTAHNGSVIDFITEMRFDTKSATPKLGFSPVRWLQAHETEIVEQQAQTQEAQDAIRTTVFQAEMGLVPNVASPQQLAPTPVTSNTVHGSALQSATIAQLQAELARLTGQAVASDQPVVVPSKASTAPPQSVASVMAQWETKGEAD